MPAPSSDHPKTTGEDLLCIYQLLLDQYGPRRWWPADTPFEMAVGAILTQNTAWTNVEKAIANLRRAGMLDSQSMANLERGELEALIHPAGFFRQKSERLQLFSHYLLTHHNGRLEVMLEQSMASARGELLALKGVGPETADSILLYAGGHPSFVIDAYTRRVLERLGRLPGIGRYEEMRQMFMDLLPTDAPLFNEYHALLVNLCKENCRKRQPLCGSCPLLSLCPTGKQPPL